MADTCAVPLCPALRKRDSWLCVAHDDAVLKGDYSWSITETPAAESPKAHKWHAKATEVDGIHFQSQREAEHYCDLKLMVKGGLIRDLELQAEYALVIIAEDGQAHTVGVHRIDFRFFDIAQNRTRLHEVKGKDLPMGRLKRKIVMARYGIDIEIVT